MAKIRARKKRPRRKSRLMKQYDRNLPNYLDSAERALKLLRRRSKRERRVGR